MLKLLSLNILCGTVLRPYPIFRIHKQIKKIKKLNPDIICFQEFNNPFIEYIYKRELSMYHYHIKYVSWKELLRRKSILLGTGFLVNYFNYFFIYLALIFYPYIFNFIIGRQKTGNVIFWKKGIDLNSFEVNEFNYQSGDFLNIMRKRGYIKFNINDITIINTHLDHIGTTQKIQMEEIINKNNNSKIIVLGDLNTEKINLFLENNYIDNTKSIISTYTKNFNCIKKNKKLDYILSKNVSIYSIETIDLDSDHLGLICYFIP